jgi:fructose-1,6-bisphosphatase II / sedoheptulose-1,7-bisphosphatase
MKQIHLDMVRVTEAAAIAAAVQVGRGDKLEADKVATEAMRERLNRIEFGGRIVLGEGIKDGSYGLFFGEKVGKYRGSREDYQLMDVVLDPIEGTTPTSKGGPEALSVLAVGDPGCLFSSDIFYMKKLAVGPKIAKYDVHMDMSLSHLVDVVGFATGKSKEQITFCVLDRPRHEDLIKQIRTLGCRIRLISDCDVSGALATCVSDSGIDVYMGVGGTPEGVISAVALKCMRGYFEGQLCDKEGKVMESKVYSMNELAKDDVMFCGTGITDGSLLRGVHYPNGRAKTHSVLMRSESGTVRWISSEHGN